MSKKSREEFHSLFFKSSGLHDSTMNHLHGSIQIDGALTDIIKFNEYYFQSKLEIILDARVARISKYFKVHSNITYSEFEKELVMGSESAIDPQFDIHIVTENGELLAAYEVKSIFGTTLRINDVLRDFARLSITNKLFPEAKCIFILVGNKRELGAFLSSYNFPFNNNIRRGVKVHHKWIDIKVKDLGRLEDNYKQALTDLDITDIQVKLSRTQTSRLYHCLSYQIRIKPPERGDRSKTDFEKCNWNDIREGDIVYEGFEPPKKISSCDTVDQIDLSSSNVMFQTNDVDDQIWREIDIDSIVWRYIGRL